MPEARIVCHDPHPVQAGPHRLEQWVVEFEPEAKPGIEPLMGWTSSTDMLQQVRIPFATLAAAETYCRRRGLAYVIQAPRHRKRRPRSYADNFQPGPDGGPKPLYPH